MAKAKKEKATEKPAKSEKKAVVEKKPLTKAEIITQIATTTELTKKQVSDVLDALGEEIKNSLGKKGAGSFTLPGLLKIEKKHVKATPEKKNIPNPLRPGEFITRKAKPAHFRVKIKPLKSLKDTV